ncbi:ABC transporter permease [Sedimentibacter sp. zth1]|uniref:ABC transporter permease n=1 Tax=Sedimentibacter sp. zth1 TaxID=2816908 RepID=UPI001A92B428|nr:ABC transporter permease [Sedimentibacter sp. zth1]QSX07132.1 ABC transporter permease [Sedimentibacter sp. zth1]
MIKLMSIVKIEFLLLKRNKFIYFLFVLFILYTALGYKFYLQTDYIEAGQMLQSSAYITIALIIVGLFSGILLSQKEKKSNFNEILISMPGDNLRPFAKLFFWFVLSAIFYIVSTLIMLLYFSMAGSEFVLFTKEIFTYTFLYWFCALFSSGILGMFLGTCFKSIWLNIIFICLITILFSPLNTYVFNFLPNQLINFINIGENLEYAGAYKEFSGLNLDHYMFLKVGAYFLFSVSLFLIGSYTKKIKKLLKTDKIFYRVSIPIALILFFMISYFYGISFNNYLKMSPYSYNFFYAHKKNLPYLYTQEQKSNENFIAKSYQINIDIYNYSVYYKANVALKQVKSDMLTFTLYHKFKVTSINSEGQTLKYNQEGDYLYVYMPNDSDNITLNFEIECFSDNACIIKKSSLFLPPNIPWYPIPGAHTIARVSNFSDYYLEYENTDLKSPCDFEIEVSGVKNTFSNLDITGENKFKGNKTQACILGGMFISRSENDISYVMPPDRTEYLSSIINDIKAEFESTHESQMKIPDKIFVMPTNLFSCSQQILFTDDVLYIADSAIAYYSDYIKEAITKSIYDNPNDEHNDTINKKKTGGNKNE